MRLIRPIAVVTLLCVVALAASRQSVLHDSAERCVAGASEQKEEALFAAKNHSAEWERMTADEVASCETCRDTASVWRSPAATLVRFEQSTETGDWTRVVDYCFDQHGRATAALLNFNYLEDWGLVAYYAVRDGKFVQTTRMFRKLRTWSSISEPPMWSDYRRAHGTPAPYLTIGQLPFATALRHPQ